MSKTRRSFQFLFSLTLLLSSEAFGAACCGGGFAAPSVIVGDEAAQATISYGYSRIEADVGADSLWRKREAIESSQTLKIDAARVFDDRWQAGVTIPVVKRARAGVGSSGFGDIAGTVGYEYLPDWDYNPWRPRGLGFLQLTAPTGRSINEADGEFQLDSRGRGFWALGAGTIFTKARGRWDFFASVAAHRSFEKVFSNSVSSGTLRPGFGGEAGAGAGYNLASVRFGGALTWSAEDAVEVVGTTASKGVAQRAATAALSASWLAHDELAATVTYTDQTLFGDPLNTTLSRGIAVLVQRRWPR